MGNYIEDLIHKSAENPNWERDENYSKAFYLVQRLGLYEEFKKSFSNWEKMNNEKFLENFGIFILFHGVNIKT